MKRGRKSAASLAIMPLKVPPPEPPANLTPEQAECWREVVGSLPSNWLPRDVWPLLESYCRSIATSRQLSKVIQAFTPDMLTGAALTEFGRLCTLRAAENANMWRMATKLRLTNQSRLRSETAARQANNAPRGRKPWEPVA